MRTGIELIAEERTRQVNLEGWTSDHDDLHDGGQLIQAGLAYEYEDKSLFPFDEEWWKPTTPIGNRVKSGALYMAEIDRLQRRIKIIAGEIDDILQQQNN